MMTGGELPETEPITVQATYNEFTVNTWQHKINFWKLPPLEVQPVIIAVVDSGMEGVHDQLIPGSYEFEPPFWDNHGTRIARVIASHDVRAGSCFHELCYLRSFQLERNPDGLYNWIQAIGRACRSPGVRVVNMSLHLRSENFVNDVLEYCHRKGIVMVAAAGNDASASEINYPASHPYVIAVAGDTDDVYQGLGIEIRAPSRAYSSDGSSVATGIVSGAIALAFSVNKNLTSEQIRGILNETKGPDKMLDMSAFIAEVQKY